MNQSKFNSSFSSKYLKDDLPAGLVVFLVALPLCLGIALASGAPLFAGIISGIVGGTLSETGEYLKLPIKSSINKYSLSLVNADTELKLSKLGEKAGIIGACLLAKNKALSLI